MWAERVPAIRVYLERCKESGTLPITNRGRLNRKAVLREFAPHLKSLGWVLSHENSAVKALLDEYDVIQGDERYSPYKYDALEGELKELLDRDPFELVRGRKINTKALLPEGSASGGRCCRRRRSSLPSSRRSRRKSTRCSGGG